MTHPHLPTRVVGDDEPRIDKVSGQFFRKGKCGACGGSAERLKTFEGMTLAQCQAQADTWAKEELFHKRCEPQ